MEIANNVVWTLLMVLNIRAKKSQNKMVVVWISFSWDLLDLRNGGLDGFRVFSVGTIPLFFLDPAICKRLIFDPHFVESNLRR